MQVKNRRQEKVCVSNLNFAFFKKEQKGSNYSAVAIYP